MKVKRRVVAMLFVILLALGTVSVQAASYGITADVDEEYFEATYEYGKAGYLLKIEVDFTEKHSQTGQVFSSSCSNIATGGYTRVNISRAADAGYKYQYMDIYGFTNGTKLAELLDVRP